MDKQDILSASRDALRIPSDVTAYDNEIADLIDAARSELRAGGISDEKASDDTDGSIRLAIMTYVRAHFGMDNPDADRLMQAFDSMRCSMAGNHEYRSVS